MVSSASSRSSFPLVAAAFLGGFLLARTMIARRKRTASTSKNEFGKVYLIGAGPGSADLLTLRAQEVLERATIVLVDRLVDPSVGERARRRGAIVRSVGKSSKKDRFSQENVEHELVAAARSVGVDGIVVRLKGGDPFVFGLGGSEANVLSASGVRWEVIPGLSSAIAIPGLIGVPLTHKSASSGNADEDEDGGNGLASFEAANAPSSSGFVVLSGHADPFASPEWSELPICAYPRTTLVVLMCHKNLKLICDFLMTSRNWSFDLPCALVRNGSTEKQLVLETTLKECMESIKGTGLDAPPLLLIVGKSCRALTERPSRLSKLNANVENASMDEGGVWGVSRR